MIRTALDSDDLTAFTDNTDFILTYTDLITDPLAFERAHPGQMVRYIDRGLGDPGDKSTIIDVERGARTPADVPGWFDDKERKGERFLTVYVNRSNLAAVDAVLAGRGAWRWIATLDGAMHIEGFQPMHWPALVQTTGAAALGIHADFSVVLSPGWNPSPRQVQITNLVGSLQVAVTNGQRETAELLAALELAKTLH